MPRDVWALCTLGVPLMRAMGWGGILLCFNSVYTSNWRRYPSGCIVLRCFLNVVLSAGEGGGTRLLYFLQAGRGGTHPHLSIREY